MNRFQRINSLKRLLARRSASSQVEATNKSRSPELVHAEGLKAHPLFHQKQQMVELEGRLLFDAAAFSTGMDVAADALDDFHISLDDDGDGDVIDPAVSAILADALDFTTAPFSKTVVFVDAAVSDLSAFVNVDDPTLEFFLINSNEDGFGQVADALAGRTDVASVHIISHGQAGVLQLGNSMISRADLPEYTAELAIIGDALTNDGDLLIYGCNVADGQTGHKFIQSLSIMTGADIAASSDWTGDGAQGGDWELEASIGEIDVASIFGADGDIGYSNLLAAPVNTAPAAVTVIEDVAYEFLTTSLAPTVSVFDADNDNLLVVLTVSNGTLSLTDFTGIVVSGNGTATVVMNGAYADINSNLATLQYTTDQDFTGTDTLTITTDDAGSTAISNTLIVVSAVNDAPVIVIPGAQSISEDTQTLIPGISISDVDDLGSVLSVDLAVSSGQIDINSAGITVTYRSGSGDALSISGTKAALNAALTTLSYKPGQDFVGADALSISVNDNGNSGAGGALADMNSVALNVTPVNDAPVLTAPAGYDVYSETQTSLTGLSFNDVDGSALLNMKITLSVSNGTLAYTGPLVPASGNPAGDTSLTFVAAPAALNQMLLQLSYESNLGFVGTDQMIVNIDDDGNTGAGGAQITSDGVAIEVHSKDEPDFNISDTDPLGTGFDLLDRTTLADGLENLSFPPPKLTVASAIGEFRVANDSEPMRAVVEGRGDDFDAQNAPSIGDAPIRAGLSFDQENRDFKANVLSPEGLADDLDSDTTLNKGGSEENETAKPQTPGAVDPNSDQEARADEASVDAEATSDAIELSPDKFDRDVDQLLNDLGSSTPSSEE